MSPLEYGAESLRDSCATGRPLLCVPNLCCQLPLCPWALLGRAGGSGQGRVLLGFLLCPPGFAEPRSPQAPRGAPAPGARGARSSVVPRTRTAGHCPALRDRHPADTGTHTPTVSSSFLPWHLPLPRRCPARCVPGPATAAAPHLAQRWAAHADLPAERHRSAPVCASLPSPLRSLVALLHCESFTAWPAPSAPFPGTVLLPKQLSHRK